MEPQEKTLQLLNTPLVVINIGLEGFGESLEDQEVEVVKLDWSPPAGGDQEMIDILDGLI
jgi:FdrA protein